MHSARQCWRKATLVSSRRALNHVVAERKANGLNAVINNATNEDRPHSEGMPYPRLYASMLVLTRDTYVRHAQWQNSGRER